MNVIYSDRIKQQRADLQLLQHATEQLEEILGPSAGIVKVEWDRTADARGRSVYTLRLSDWMATASASFSPRELHSVGDLCYRLIRLWGDVLQERNHKQLEKLLEMASPGGD